MILDKFIFIITALMCIVTGIIAFSMGERLVFMMGVFFAGVALMGYKSLNDLKTVKTIE